jgi:hypothetical protein
MKQAEKMFTGASLERESRDFRSAASMNAEEEITVIVDGVQVKASESSGWASSFWCSYTCSADYVCEVSCSRAFLRETVPLNGQEYRNFDHRLDRHRGDPRPKRVEV